VHNLNFDNLSFLIDLCLPPERYAAEVKGKVSGELKQLLK
jgi:hypothetical protein